MTDDVIRRASPGVEIQPIRTVDGDRTNITFYSDIRVDDRFRAGAVNDGWSVLGEALNAEHGTVERNDSGSAKGLFKIAVMTEHSLLLAVAVDRVAAEAPIDDVSVGYRLGHANHHKTLTPELTRTYDSL